MSAPYLLPLDIDVLREEGIPEPWKFGICDRVRFTELDALNHANNATYLSWFENVRLAYFKAYGIGDYASEEERPHLVLRQVGIDYMASLFLDERYILCARTRQLRTTSFTMDYAVFARGRLCVTSHAVVVWLDKNGQKQAVPDHARAILIGRDNPETV